MTKSHWPCTSGQMESWYEQNTLKYGKVIHIVPSFRWKPVNCECMLAYHHNDLQPMQPLTSYTVASAQLILHFAGVKFLWLLLRSISLSNIIVTLFWWRTIVHWLSPICSRRIRKGYIYHFAFTNREHPHLKAIMQDFRRAIWTFGNGINNYDVCIVVWTLMEFVKSLFSTYTT